RAFATDDLDPSIPQDRRGEAPRWQRRSLDKRYGSAVAQRHQCCVVKEIDVCLAGAAVRHHMIPRLVELTPEVLVAADPSLALSENPRQRILRIRPGLGRGLP